MKVLIETSGPEGKGDLNECIQLAAELSIRYDIQFNVSDDVFFIRSYALRTLKSRRYCILVLNEVGL